jgi:hypothetical protein
MDIAGYRDLSLFLLDKIEIYVISRFGFDPASLQTRQLVDEIGSIDHDLI